MGFSGGPLRGSGRHGGRCENGGVGAEAAELHQHAASHKGNGTGSPAHRLSGPSASLPPAFGGRGLRAPASESQSQQSSGRQTQDVQLRGKESEPPRLAPTYKTLPRSGCSSYLNRIASKALFTGVRGRGVLRTSPCRPSAKFALMEFLQIRVWQDSYSRLYEP